MQYAIGGLAYVLRLPVCAISNAFRYPISEPDNVRGRHVFITGGATGFGKALAIHYARGGARVTIASHNEKNLISAVNDIRKEAECPASAVRYVVCDVTDEDMVQSAIAQAWDQDDQHVFPQTCVLSAGLSHPGRFADIL